MRFAEVTVAVALIKHKSTLTRAALLHRRAGRKTRIRTLRLGVRPSPLGRRGDWAARSGRTCEAVSRALQVSVHMDGSP